MDERRGSAAVVEPDGTRAVVVGRGRGAEQREAPDPVGERERCGRIELVELGPGDPQELVVGGGAGRAGREARRGLGQRGHSAGPAGEAGGRRSGSW